MSLQCLEAADALWKSNGKRHTKQDNFARRQNLQHRRGCFVREGCLVTFNDVDGSAYGSNGYGREICQVSAVAKTTAFGIPQTTKTSYKAIGSSASATAVPSSKVRFSSTTVRVSSISQLDSNTVALSKACQVCFDVCVEHCKPCDPRDAEKTCRPFCALKYGCPITVSPKISTTNQTAAALQHSENELSLSFDTTVIAITSGCVLVVIMIMVAIVVSVRRATFCKTQVLHFEAVEAVEVVQDTYPSFDADEDWSVGMVMDELHVKMTESPLHQMIRKQRGRSISCGSEDMGRERQQVGQWMFFSDVFFCVCIVIFALFSAERVFFFVTNPIPSRLLTKRDACIDLVMRLESQNAHFPVLQQCEKPELIPSYDWQMNGRNGTNDYSEETSKTTYGSFDKDDEELRMDIDGRWYTRMEFQVVCI